MRWTRTLSRWLAAAAAGLFPVCLVLAWASGRDDAPTQQRSAGLTSPGSPAVPLFKTTRPATNRPAPAAGSPGASTSPAAT